MSLVSMILTKDPIMLAEVAQTGEQNLFQLFSMVGMAVAFFYFVLLRPEQKRKKKLQDLRAALKKGDKVTAMGIVATIETIKDHTVILKQVDGHHIEMLKVAISDVEVPKEK